MYPDDRYIPKATTALVLINILIFVILEIMGDTEDGLFLEKYGALSVRSFEAGKTYVLFTAMFLHFGFAHLANNMFVLFFTGRFLEQETGPFWFTVIYILGGLCGNALSLFNQYRSGGLVISAGASGAIFAVIGALALLVLLHVGKLAHVRREGIILMVVLSVYQGYTAVNVDNAAHLAGLFGGLLLGAVYAFVKKYKRTS